MSGFSDAGHSSEFAASDRMIQELCDLIDRQRRLMDLAVVAGDLNFCQDVLQQIVGTCKLIEQRQRTIASG